MTETPVPVPAAADIPTIEAIRERLTALGAPFEMETATIRGIETPVWKHVPRTVRDVIDTARGHGERDMLVYEDERVTYAAFHRAVSALAHDLAAHGFVKGDRLAIAMRNLPEWPVAYFACVGLGGIVTPLNAWGTPAELAYGLSDSGARMAVVDGERHDRLVGEYDGLPRLERVYVTRADGAAVQGRAVALEDLVGQTAAWATLPDRDLPPASIDPEDIATIYYTSGTTGRPKGAYASHRATLSNIGVLPFIAARTALRNGEPMPVADPDAPRKAGLVGLPLFHVTGCNIILIPNIHAGNKLVVMRKWDVERAYELIEQERITSSGGVPALAWQLLEHPRRGDFDLSSIERINWGGAAGSPELESGMRTAFPGVSMSTGWGMTEVCGIHTDIAGRDFALRPDSCGTPVGNYKFEVRGAGGEVLPPGEIGELWAFGPNIAIGYWNRPEASAETFIDGWVRTGDIGRMDDEGFFFIVDRAKDMLIRGGENIYCIEVENALYEHPAVLDAAVVGVPHRTLGEEPAAVVMLRAGETLDEDTLRAFVRERIAGFKVPVRIVFSAELLPRNPAGKVLKPACKAMLGA